MTSTTWESKVAAKHEFAQNKILKEWLLPTSVSDALQIPVAEHPNHVLQMELPRNSGLFSDRELAITENYTVEELLKRLRDDGLSSLEVTVAFSKRAAIAQQLV
jgi:amidase